MFDLSGVSPISTGRSPSLAWKLYSVRKNKAMPTPFQNQSNRQQQQQFRRFQQRNRERSAKQVNDLMAHSRAARRQPKENLAERDQSVADSSEARGRRTWWSLWLVRR